MHVCSRVCMWYEHGPEGEVTSEREAKGKRVGEGSAKRGSNGGNLSTCHVTEDDGTHPLRRSGGQRQRHRHTHRQRHRREVQVVAFDFVLFSGDEVGKQTVWYSHIPEHDNVT